MAERTTQTPPGWYVAGSVRTAYVARRRPRRFRYAGASLPRSRVPIRRLVGRQRRRGRCGPGRLRRGLSVPRHLASPIDLAHLALRRRAQRLPTPRAARCGPRPRSRGNRRGRPPRPQRPRTPRSAKRCERHASGGDRSLTYGSTGDPHAARMGRSFPRRNRRGDERAVGHGTITAAHCPANARHRRRGAHR